MTLEERIADLARAMGADVRALRDALASLPPPAPPVQEDEIVARAVRATLATLARLALEEVAQPYPPP